MIRQRHAVARLDSAVRRKWKKPARSAGTHNYSPGQNRMHLSGQHLNCGHPLTTAILNKKLGCEILVIPLSAKFERGLIQGMQHVKPSLICGKPGSLDGHPTKGPHRHVTIWLPTPRASPMFHLDHLTGRFLDEGFDHVLVTQPIGP